MGAKNSVQTSMILLICVIMTNVCYGISLPNNTYGQCVFQGNETQEDLQALAPLIGQRFTAGDAEEHGLQYDIGICITAWPEKHLPPLAAFQTAGNIRHLKHPQPGEEDSYIRVLGNLQRAIITSKNNSLTLQYINDKFTSCKAHDFQRTVIKFYCTPKKTLIDLIKWQHIYDAEKENCFLLFELHHKTACSVEKEKHHQMGDSKHFTKTWLIIIIVSSLLVMSLGISLLLLKVHLHRKKTNFAFKYSQVTTGSEEEWKVTS